MLNQKLSFIYGLIDAGIGTGISRCVVFGVSDFSATSTFLHPRNQMASFETLPVELFDQVLHHLALDGKALLSVRALSRRHRDYVDSMLPEIAWRLAEIGGHAERDELDWIGQQMYDELQQIRAAYWKESEVMLHDNRVEWKCSKPDKRQRVKMADSKLSVASTATEPSNSDSCSQDWWLSSDCELPHVLATFERLACDEWWMLCDGEFPAILAFFEDPLAYPLGGATPNDPWWAISRSSAPFVLRNLRDPASAQHRAPYRNLARIRRMVRLRDVITYLCRLSKEQTCEGQTVALCLESNGFLEYWSTISEVLLWEAPPCEIQLLRHWIFLDGLRMEHIKVIAESFSVDNDV